MKRTDWDAVSKTYHRQVGQKGHYYHEHVIFPRLMPLLNLPESGHLLDLGCGQGVLTGYLPKKFQYTGIDLSPQLIAAAKKRGREAHRFLVQDATEPFNLGEEFTHAVSLLAIQNMREGGQAIENAAKHLVEGGSFTCVLNHPCFRIPRQSHWHINREKKLQSRLVDRYMSPLEIPIDMAPSKGEKSVKTLSFHHPLETYFTWFRQAGLLIESVEEWVSDKESVGKGARMENRARKEFPLFLAIKGIKHVK